MGVAQQVEKILEYVAWTLIWNKYFAILFLVLGLYMTIGTRFIQFRRFGDILRNTAGTLFQKAEDRKDKGSIISSFGAFAVSCIIKRDRNANQKSPLVQGGIPQKCKGPLQA